MPRGVSHQYTVPCVMGHWTKNKGRDKQGHWHGFPLSRLQTLEQDKMQRIPPVLYISFGFRIGICSSISCQDGTELLIEWPFYFQFTLGSAVLYNSNLPWERSVRTWESPGKGLFNEFMKAYYSLLLFLRGVKNYSLVLRLCFTDWQVPSGLRCSLTFPGNLLLLDLAW